MTAMLSTAAAAAFAGTLVLMFAIVAIFMAVMAVKLLFRLL